MDKALNGELPPDGISQDAWDAADPVAYSIEWHRDGLEYGRIQAAIAHAIMSAKAERAAEVHALVTALEELKDYIVSDCDGGTHFDRPVMRASVLIDEYRTTSNHSTTAKENGNGRIIQAYPARTVMEREMDWRQNPRYRAVKLPCKASDILTAWHSLEAWWHEQRYDAPYEIETLRHRGMYPNIEIIFRIGIKKPFISDRPAPHPTYRRPDQIIGHDAHMQLIFEGYAVIRADRLKEMQDGLDALPRSASRPKTADCIHDHASDIPEAVMAAAKAAAYATEATFDGAAAITSLTGVRVIARAIMAAEERGEERERQRIVEEAERLAVTDGHDCSTLIGFAAALLGPPPTGKE